MNFADGARIVSGEIRWKYKRMNASEARRAKDTKRANDKPALSCAICKRRYRRIETPGMLTIYSICPDCRLDAEPEGHI
jgi:hypothetical protein